ncbi:threonine--tRNA ligase [Candidatus Uhrbacteria bacterium RIFCSPHIGHO2_01_FULL_47_10]|nr:MAG: threonine--tRNA ligase [Candidatus Uhrbacteria bacterium RIFCSPHIGHO2_01_FULL_47_10]
MFLFFSALSTFSAFMLSPEQLEHRRHSLAHLLAAAVMELWPDTKRTIGPAIDDGFYYDFAFSTPITEEDLPKIEAKMKSILPAWDKFDREDVSVDQAKQAFADNPFKLELINQFSGEGQSLTFYKSGAFSDLCRGGHDEGLSHVDPESFKLSKVSGAYWRGDEKNPMLTRIYGLAFETKAELDVHLAMLEEAKKRDHRKLGAELELFTYSALVGSGLPMFTPRGTAMRESLTGFVTALMKPHKYSRVWIPHIAKSDLYKTSGHWDKFADDIFHVTSKKTDDQFVLKPMNCPHHTQIYASKMRSYRDLPLRFAEATTVYRDENTGQLAGLTRVRSITQDDAHVFARPDQVKEEVLKIYDIITKFYAAFGMPLRIRLSVDDPEHPEKYLGGAEVWSKAVASLKELLEELGKTYELGVGEAAFYGPKIDFIATDAIGRDWQLATVQLDFNLPERFELEFHDADGQIKRPVMIHRAILGSVERFMGVLIEHYAGAFPFWLAPAQVRVATVSEAFIPFATTILDQLTDAGIRAELDDSNEKVGKKIREAATMKVPWTIVIGQKEVDGGDFKVNVFGQTEDVMIAASELVAKAVEASKYPIM